MILISEKIAKTAILSPLRLPFRHIGTLQTSNSVEEFVQEHKVGAFRRNAHTLLQAIGSVVRPWRVPFKILPAIVV
jgi:hypothetical protein